MLHTCCYWGIPYIIFSTEQISHMSFYYVENVCYKNQLGTYSVEMEVQQVLMKLEVCTPQKGI